MNDLHIQLPEPIRNFAGAQVSSGRFQSMSDYVGALVSADEKSQQAIRGLDDNPKLAALLEEGLSSSAGRRWSVEVLNDLKQQVYRRVNGGDAT